MNNKYYFILWEHPHYFESFNYNKKKLMLHRGSMKYYYNYFEGRPNAFIIFIIKSLKLLNNNGILAYILPKSFLNCHYYNKTRKFIIENYYIIHLSILIKAFESIS